MLSKSTTELSIKSKPFYPDQWDDDSIMSKMMSNLPNKNLNPSTYSSIMKFWHEAIEKYCITVENPFISLFDLKHAFRRNKAIPASLKDVINELHNKQLLIDPNALSVQANKVISGNSIVTNLSWVAASVSYGLSGMLNWLVNGNNIIDNVEQCKYIHLPSLRKLSRQLMAKLRERQNTDVIHGPPELMSKEEFLSYSTSTTGFSEDTLMAILNMWITEKFVTVGYSTNPRIEVLKFNEHFKSPSSTNYPVFQDIDASIYNLIMAIKTRENQINHIVEMNDKLKEQARICIKNKDKGSALRKMKKYKSTELTIEKMESSKNKLEDILYNITLTKDNAKIVELMRYGNETMKNINKENGITIEKVDEIIDDIEEGIRDKEEVEDAISRLNTTPSIDDESLEKEFEEIMKNDTNLKGTSIKSTTSSVLKRISSEPSLIPEKSRKIVFPSVPENSPSLKRRLLIR
ncbi:Charged multivesicular body protein 7 [Strongyloides ratti]|uniref:Charged multivesicular body protein 7 n=1 Tax=Strongyloides ratti TaxID=34506 RepID=A0A090MV07_STRRB|nr:Charged multivesicular body protein 7 [Strongyloides ratti]CEF62568.1 Charged multivesicular body protein 7 [Strongyloides ratti]